MPIHTARRVVAFVATAALTAYAVASVAVWTVTLWAAARRSGAPITRDIF